MISALVVDDHTLFRRGVVELLTENGVTVVGEAANGAEAIDLAKRLRPDVVLMDLHMPETDGVEATRLLAPEFRVLVLTVSESDDDLSRAIEAGASGYVLKNIEPDELVRAVTSVARGGHVLSPAMAAAAVKAVRRESAESVAGLSDRERQVLGLISQGRSNIDIGRDLGISEHTVKTYVERVFDKLDVHSRAEAAGVAAKLGIDF